MENDKSSKRYYFYVLKCADGSFYGGFTTNLKHRLAVHNAGKGAKYTRVKSRRPLVLINHETFSNKSDALKAEYAFKHQSRQKKESFLEKHHISW